jgi:hypothetical protein
MNSQLINTALWENFVADVRRAKQQTNLKTIKELWLNFGAGGPFKPFSKPIQNGKIKEQDFIESMEQLAMSGLFD